MEYDMGPLYIANWKMNLHYADIEKFVSLYNQRLRLLAARPNILFGIAPTPIGLPILAHELQGSHIQLVGQNCSQYIQGAYTGEISAQSLKEVGCRFCLVGHSERRQLYGEKNEVVIEKIQRLLEQKINPIICIGETLQERKDGILEAVLNDQLHTIIKIILKNNSQQLYIAYEPQWCIGSGQLPTSAELEHAAMIIRKIVFNQDIYVGLKILYGGSIKPENIQIVRKIKLYNGFLLGNSSLDMQTLEKIVI